MGTGRRVLLVVAGAAAVRVLMQRGMLPEMVASHFDAAGRPNGGMTRDVFVGVQLGVIVLLAGLFLVLPALLLRTPNQLINWPNRDYWLAPERRQASLERIGDWLTWFAVATLAFVAFVNELVLRANTSGSGRLDSTSLVVALVAFGLFTAGWIGAAWRLFRVPRR
jgi:uncharacterized membrane protein